MQKKKPYCGTWKIYMKYSSTGQSTLQKINSQRFHYFCLLSKSAARKLLYNFQSKYRSLPSK